MGPPTGATALNTNGFTSTDKNVSPKMGVDPLPPAIPGEVGAEVGPPTDATAFNNGVQHTSNNKCHNLQVGGAQSSRKARHKGHRCKLSSPSKLWSACITENINRKDPRFHEKPAQDAVRDEFNNLDARGTWDRDDVMEAGAAKRKYRTVTSLGVSRF